MRTKAINIAGIPFTDEMLENLKQWIIPASKVDDPMICLQIDSLEKVMDFFLSEWENMGSDSDVHDKKIKRMLISLQTIKNQLKCFVIEPGLINDGEKKGE